MNVTSNGYYTSSYLNSQRNRRRNRVVYDNYYSLNSPPYYNNSHTDSYIDSQPIVHEPEMYSTVSSIRSKRTVSDSEIPRSSPLSYKSTPDSSMVSSPRSPSRQSSASSLTTSQMFVPDEETPENEEEEQEQEEDPDRLEEEPTPAHLNYLNNQYVPYRPRQRNPYQPPPARHYPRRVQRPINKNGDYYINQQKRYDKASDLKPKLYSHRTFKDVFVNKEEKLDRYNPMDLVFEGKDDNKKTFLKNVQVILKKDDYNDYNYYDHKQKEKKKSPVKEVFVSDNKDSDSDIESIDQETFLNEEQRKLIKKNSNLKKAWKKKIAKAKKELGRDFDKFAIKQNEIEHELKEKKEKEKAAKREAKEKEKTVKKENKEEPEHEKRDDETMKEPKVPKEEKKEKKEEKSSVGWNYLLSLVKYENPDNKKSPAKSKPISESPYSKNTKLINKKLKGFTKSSKVIFGNWNQPVANVLSGELPKKKSSSSSKSISIRTKSNKTKSLHSSIHETEDGESKEFIIECDSEDDEDIAEELYYNPITKQLEPSPPTSLSSMEVGDDITISSTSSGIVATRSPIFNQTMTHARTFANRFLTLDSSAPVEVVSNFVLLIKRIDILKRIFSPIDAIGEWFPQSQTVVIFIELGIFMWILFELSRLIDALCMMIKAFCAPMIAIGRFMNRIM